MTRNILSFSLLLERGMRRKVNKTKQNKADEEIAFLLRSCFPISEAREPSLRQVHECWKMLLEQF